MTAPICDLKQYSSLIQVTGFALGGKATASGLLAAGPLGWAILGCMVVVVAYTSYKAAKASGRAGEAAGSIIYDRVNYGLLEF